MISRFKGRPARVRFRPDLRKGGISQVEMRYSAYLAAEKMLGRIADFWHGKLTWKLADGLHYRADFLVQSPDGLLELHEVKGGKRNKDTGEWKPWTEEDAMQKAKMMAELCPIPIRIAFEAGKNNWQFKELGAWLGESGTGTNDTKQRVAGGSSL